MTDQWDDFEPTPKQVGEWEELLSDVDVSRVNQGPKLLEIIVYTPEGEVSPTLNKVLKGLVIAFLWVLLSIMGIQLVGEWAPVLVPFTRPFVILAAFVVTKWLTQWI